jgi:signal transduction histidine kinase
VGLGLAIAAELIRAHGGEIRLHGTGPEGTVFHVVVPDAVVELRPGRRGARNRA